MKDIRFEFEAIGTHWVIDIYKELSSAEESSLRAEILERIKKFDLDYSRFKDESLVMKMFENPGTYEMPEDFDKMIDVYKKIYDATGGKVTPLIGNVLSDAGYDKDYSLTPKPMSVAPKWDEVLEWQKPKLTLKQKQILDFGAGGKGYLIDIVSEISESKGIKNYCVDAGGDMRVGDESLKVGLEHPQDATMIIGTIEIKNQSLCGSAGNRRVWADFHHVIDPDRLVSPKEISAIWTTASDTLTADILTTGLFFVSPEVLLKEFDFEYLIIKNDNSFDKSPGFQAEIFTN